MESVKLTKNRKFGGKGNVGRDGRQLRGRRRKWWGDAF